MLEIVSGSRPGLNLGSREVLGQAASSGNAAVGRNGQGVYVNVSNGLLVVQTQDEYLAARGQDAAAIRTYNSAGVFNDDNGDNWSADVLTLRLFGTVNTAGSSMYRIDRDGSTSIYNFDAARNLYVTTEGSGAYDTLSWVGADNQFEWRDGATGATQRFEGSGSYRVLSSRDTSGNSLAYAYGAGGLLSSVTSASGDVTWYDYAGSNLTQIRAVDASGAAVGRVRYQYDAQNRLTAVTVDVDPAAAPAQRTLPASATGQLANSADFDLNGDGRSDVLWRHAGTGGNLVWLSGDDQQAMPIDAVADIAWKVAGIADFSGDGSADILWRNGVTGDNVIWNNGNRNSTRTVGPVPVDWDIAGVGDFDGNGAADILWQNLAGTNAIWLGGANATFGGASTSLQPIVSGTDTTWKIAGVGDFNDDGRDDLLWRNTVSGSNVIWRSANMANAQNVATVTSPDMQIAGVADFNGDGVDDILWRNTATGDSVIWRGGDSAQSQAVALAGVEWVVAGTGDYNGDGKADILWRNSATGSNAVWYSANIATSGFLKPLADPSWSTVSQDNTWVSAGRYSGDVADGKVYRTTYTYDGTSKRIASIRQTDGTNLAFTYVDTGGGNYKVATLTDGLNQTSTFTYGSGFSTVTDAQGLVTRYDYDASLQLTRITAPTVAGGAPVRQFAYNANGDVIRVTDGEGRIVDFEYDASGNQKLQRDQLGNTVERTFNAANQVLTQTVYVQPDPDGSGAAKPGTPLTRRFVYDTEGRNLLLFGVSAEGRVTEHRYNGFGEEVTSITYAAGQYPVAGLAAGAALTKADLVAWAGTQNLAATQRVDSVYDGRGQLQKRTSYARVTAAGDGIADGSESVERYVHDAAGLLLQTISGTGAVTSCSYDRLGRVLSATDASGQVALTQYNDAGRKTVLTLASGLVTTNAYDAAGRLISVSQGNAAAAQLGETKYFYDSGGRLRMTQDPTGVRNWMLYDDAGQKVADIDGNGTMTEYSYDRGGLVTRTVVWGTAVNTAGLVDGGGLPVTTLTLAAIRPVGSTSDFATWNAYDAAQRLVRMAQSTGTGATAAVTETRYDGASRIIEVVRYANIAAADGGATSVAPGVVPLPTTSAQDRSTRNFYDGDGRLAGTLDAEGYLSVFSYDAANRLVERLSYATATTLALRAGGTLAQLIPASSSADIRAVTLYDGKGQVAGQVDAEGYLTESVYDANGNVTQTVRYATRVTATVTASSTLASIRPASNAADRSTSRTYDLLNRLTQETSPEGVLTQYAYGNDGKLVSTVRAAGAAEVRTLLARYDLQGRLVGELSAQGAALLTGGQTQAQVDAIWVQYGNTHAYDAASRRISTTDALGRRALFFYNADGALTHTVNALGEVRETRYDARGRVTETIAYTGRISLTGLAGGLVSEALTTTVATLANAAVDSRTTVSYSRDSNVVSSTDALGNASTYTYNAFDDQIGSSEATGAGTSLVQTYSVDRLGQRTGTVADASGVNAISSAVYDAFGRLTRSVDANGNLREQAFDRLGRVITTRDPLNATRSTSYDAFDRKLTQTDATGNVTSYGYDAAARSIKVTTAEGIVTTTTFTRHGQVLSIADGKGQATSYSYDRNGNLLQTTTPLTTTSSAYDVVNRLLETTDANGQKVSFGYDAANRVLTRAVDPTGLNLVTSYQYDGKGQAVAVTDANGTVTTTAYDRMGQVTRQTVDPTGLSLQTVYTHDAGGKTLSVTSPGGTVIQYVYDALGRRVQERVDPTGLNLLRSWAYDKNGNVLSSTDQRGNVTRYAYDAADRLVFTLDPLGNLRQLAYDAEGRVIKSVAYANSIATGALGAAPTAAQIQPLVVNQASQDVVEHRVYDKDGRTAALVDGIGAVTRYTYDANGNVVARVSYANCINLATWTPGTLPAPASDTARDSKTVTVYDGLNRALYVMDGIGAVVASTYDGNGNVTQRVAYATAIPTSTATTQTAIAAAVAAVASAARDANVRNTYDAAGRLTWSVDGTGAVTQRVYDNNGNVVRQVAYASAIAAGASATSVPAGSSDRATAMAYDAANRMVLQVDALRAVTEQVYDGNGNVIRRIAYANAIASVPALGTPGTATAIKTALTANASADRSTRYGYDAAGRQALVIDALGAVTEKQYDGAGNTIGVIAYDGLVTTSGLATVPTLAAMKALVVPNAGADRMSKSAYDAGGRLVYGVDPLGAVNYTQYDGVGRVIRSTRYAAAIPAATTNTAAAISAAVVANAAKDQVKVFGYNAAGQQIASTDALNCTETFTYDALGHKLGFVNKKGFTWTYAYDAAGRLTTETAPQVSLTSVTVSAGAIVAGAAADGAIVTRVAYDALGNLKQRTEASGRPEERVTKYEYDAVGRQVKVIYPPVGVYDSAADSALVNGATGIASRTEQLKTLQTSTFYNALGDAVASSDVEGAISQKAYDLLGRVAYEVDAMGYVTGYSRNAFGDVASLTRYGLGTSLAGVSVAQASQAATKAQVEAALAAPGFSHALDRTLLSTYDRAGRVAETSEPSGYAYDSSAAAAYRSETAGKKTRNTYDAFGQLVQVKLLRNTAADTWSVTTNYFDRAGNQAASIDALGYLTWREFDSLGRLTELREYATARTPGSWSLTGYGTVTTPSGDDRQVRYTYDQLDRKTSEARCNVEFSASANGASTRDILTTLYGYDAVGNQTVVTDTDGKTTYTYYDAIGRITAIAAPSRSSTAAGTSLTPLTVFRRDAHGNAVMQVEYANGASAADGTTFTAGAADAADRTTLAAYDSLGHTTQTTNSNGQGQYLSYDEHGHLRKKWQGVTDNDGVTRTQFDLFAYDKLGQLTATASPASTSAYQAGTITQVAQSSAGLVQINREYNAFGELTRQGAPSGREEYFDYDTAGRLWRTNGGDGVDRITLFDLQGNATAEIRSSGSGRDNIDIRGFANAQAADANPYTRRIDILYDAMGRVTQKTEAARQELQGGVSVRQQFVAVSGIQSVYPVYGGEPGTVFMGYGGANQVTLAWNSLSYLGSGDIKVALEYRTPLVAHGNDENASVVYTGGTARSYASGVFNGDTYAAGLTLNVGEPGYSDTDYGIGSVTRVVVYKKDIGGNWQMVIDQAPGYGRNEIDVAAPPDPNTGVILELRAAGTSGTGGWWTAGLVGFGNGYRFDASPVPIGSYEFRVTVTPQGAAARVTGTGTATLAQPPLNAIGTPITYGQAGAGVLAWQAPVAGTTQVLHYRAGVTGAWSTLAIAPRANGALQGVDTSGLAPGSYQFELLFTAAGQGVPTSHATGTFTVVAAVPPYWVPPVNLPPITGLAILMANGVPLLQWSGNDATVARYRSGAAWSNLAISSSGGYSGESWQPLVQAASLAGLPANGYLLEILAGSPAIAQATANFTVYPQGAGHYQTVDRQVATYEKIIAYYAPVYETRYGTRDVAYQVWVSDPPVIIGYNESGPIYSYPGHYETRYRQETYSYQVQVGQTPVYATDENGQIIYRTIWITQSEQQWVPGTAPAPTIAVTTPPYTPGHTVAGVPALYSVSVNTAAGSTAISSAEGAVISGNATLNGDDRWLRPTVLQKTDRWGNVVEITDPRSAYWKTSYKFNANNQLVLQTQPDSAGGSSANSPVTSIYYDRMGRQIAVRDANGNLNGQVYDAAGNLVEEQHAIGVVRHRYNAFGDKVKTTDAMGNVVTFSYDKMGHMLSMVTGQVEVYRANASNQREYVGRRNITESWTYDQLGRKLTQSNGNNETLRYTYDLQGNVVATTQPMGQTLRAAFDPQGRKIAEVDANGFAATWAYDYFGQLTAHTDLGGAIYTYTYDRARQLVAQSNARGQSLSYAYDAVGQVTSITDNAIGKVSTYLYDLSGRRIRERVVQGGITYQDNHLAYDALGNLRDVADARVHIAMQYDKVGNRTRVATYVNYQGVSGEATSSTDRYFRYDAMNRQIVVDGVDAAGNIGTQQGHAITYDENGNRLSDKSWGNRVTTSGGEQAIVGYGEDGIAIYANTPVNYTASQGFSTEVYRYDALNRLQGVVRDGVQIDARQYDAADRVIQSGPGGNLPVKYAEIINQGVALGEMNGKETRINRYDANGRLLHQKVLKSDNSVKVDISYDTAENYSGYVADGYDATGNTRGYVVKNNETNKASEYSISLARFEGYQAGVTSGVGSGLTPGSTTQAYDANGFMVGVTDSTKAANNRTFVNDANGVALFVNQGGKVQRQLIVNGEVLGLYGAAVDPLATSSNPTFANLVDFDFGYARISANYPNPSPGAYQVRSGDTLQSIAQGAYGDSSLWYRIAEANGIGSSSELKVGQTLNVPNRVSTVSNNSTTFKPYDPSEIQGDTTPNLAPPAAKGCGGVGKLLMVVVAVAVTIMTEGAAAGLVGQIGLTGTSASVAAGAIAAAEGAVASQVVGLATGTIDKFDWKGVALAAVGGGVAGGFAPGAFNSTFGGPMGGAMARAVVGSTASQSIAVATGLQSRFDWRGVAASAVGAGVGQAVGAALGPDILPEGVAGPVRPAAFADIGFAGSVLRGSISAFAGRLTTAVMRGGRVGVQQVAVDAFGNALGGSLAGASSSAGGQAAQAPQSGQLGSGSYGIDDADAFLFASFAGPRSATTVVAAPDSAVAGGPDAFRLSEREYRMDTEESVAGSTHRARAGDSISRIVGSSQPQAVGNFMRANNLATGRIDVGRNYFVPDSTTAYGDSAGLGQFALDQGNARVAAASANELQRELNRFASRAQSSLFTEAVEPMYAGVNLPRTPQEAAALLASLPPMTAAERLEQAVRNKVDGPVLTARDMAGEARAAAALQRTGNNIAIAAGGPIIGGYMEGARLAGMPESVVEQTGLQAAAFMDLYAPRGPGGSGMLARVRGVGRIDPNYSARLGESTTTSYRETFFKENPELRGEVWVHHAVEQQAGRLYPEEVSTSQIHSFENLRGIPKDVNSEVHLSKIRTEWNRFYVENPGATQADLLRKATEIDIKYGHLFTPPVGRKGK